MFSFIREIPFDKWSLILHFTRVHAPQEKYFVLIRDGEIDVISFEVQKDKRDQWKVMQPAPEWVFNLEEQIADVLSEAVTQAA